MQVVICSEATATGMDRERPFPDIAVRYPGPSRIAEIVVKWLIIII